MCTKPHQITREIEETQKQFEIVELTTIESGAWNYEIRADCNDWMCDLRIAKCCRLHLRFAYDVVERPTNEPVANSAIFANQLSIRHPLSTHYSPRLNIDKTKRDPNKYHIFFRMYKFAGECCSCCVYTFKHRILIHWLGL